MHRTAPLLALLCALAASCGDAPALLPDGGPACTTLDTWAGFAQPYLQQRCGGCHGLTQRSVIEDAAAITLKVQTGEMPPGAALDEAGRARLLEWLRCGSP